MNLEEYRKEVERTAAAKDETQARLLNGALGLAGESGEVCDLIKKAIFQGHHLDRVKVAEEMGDMLWYFTVLLNTLCLTQEQVMEINTLKLRHRYPKGFDPAGSKNREGEQELRYQYRKIIEQDSQRT